MSDTARLPVFQTLASGFSWPYKNVSELIKIFTLPTLLIYGPLFYLFWIVLGDALPELQNILSTTGDEAGSDGSETLDALSEELTMMNSLSSLAQLAGLVFGAMIAVPITRSIALGERPGLIRLDSKVWWYVLGQVVFPLMVFATVLGFGLAFGGAAALVGSTLDAMPAALSIGAIGVIGAIYVMLRLSLFLPSIAVLGGLPVPAAWRMAGGNVLRLFALWFFSALLFLVITLVFMGVLFGVGAFLFAEPVGALIAAGEDEAGMGAAAEALLDALFSPAGAVMLGLYLPFGLYMTAVSCTLPGYAYGALTNNLPDESS